ncbi:SpoIVB peptidase S55 [Halobacteroides halobius DSM 5150]|uniref:SpoIVB peptidase S55 n=1 Tax=Halobacteroides halobius (strain ATCC 35273 / DSM 5150 / MD-1) TaxID=748449 RepID=L0KD88_HALHC|nr:SpoIVB peptidase S55 domain-containing protein [Halobacteroides halobius]AGB42319.1 SpoIVB peptidase S55 [Halobacteroides halobius DSM 5150]
MRKYSQIVLIVFIFILFAHPVLASPQIMPLNQIKPGMKATGKTVIKGTKIEKFDVEIISILRKQVGHPLILVKTSGDLIEQTGGIASGMSGSPVYIDGKLIGAVGYGWQMANHKIGMVTPIKSMLSIFKMNQPQVNREINLTKPIRIGKRKYTKIRFATKDLEVKNKTTLVARPVTTPLLVSGLYGRAKERLAQGLKNYDVVPVNAGGLVAKQKEVTLQPGSAVAVQLVRGDINVSAIGTLTYRNKDKILAFGHPFLSKGNVNYLLSSAYIHQMIKSVKMPFKIGSPLDLKGLINQDRKAGIAGEIGKFPNVIPVRVSVTDKDLNRTRNFSFQIIKNQDLLTKLASSAVLQTIDSAIDRRGGGTSQVELKILSGSLSDELITQKNLYYSSNDIAVASLSSLLNGLHLIINNPFRKVNIAGIHLNIKVAQTSKIATIEKVKLNRFKFQPGEKIKAEITLRPYRSKAIKKKVSLKVPQDISKDELRVHVLSGREANLEQVSLNQGSSLFTSKIKGLDELVKDYEEKKQNNQLIVELRSNYASQSKPKTDKKETKLSKQKLDQVELNTDYVLNGNKTKKINIILDEDAS